MVSGKITSKFRQQGNPIQEDTGVAMNASRQRPNAGGELPPATAADPLKCLNHKELDLVGVRDHLLMYGMQSSYDRWIHHEEPSDGPESEQSLEDDGFHETADHKNADGNEDFDDDDGLSHPKISNFGITPLTHLQ
ncbi:hypothetical protein EJB05_13404, partial [Eragrostis curvula]